MYWKLNVFETLRIGNLRCWNFEARGRRERVQYYLELRNDFVFKLASPNRLSAGSGSVWTSSLHHESLDDSMEHVTVVIPVSRMHHKVLHRLWHLVLEQFDVDVARRGA